MDNYPELILELLVANQIPEDHWTATLLSDGSGTAAYLESTFAVDDPYTKFKTMSTSWNLVKKHIFLTGSYSEAYIRTNLAYAVNSPFSMLATYPYILTKEQSNVRWWVNRLRVGENLAKIDAKNHEFASDIVNTATSFYTNNLLKALDDSQKDDFKKMYHFSDEMFETARKENKKIMIILGTSWNGEKASFYDYLKMVVSMYGTDDYVFYYKGHPGYGTANYPERKQALDKLKNEGINIEELDNSIAAEVILFYNPDVYLCGWSSSTFDSVESQQMACALFNCSIENKSKFTYGDLMDSYISLIGKDSKYRSIKELDLLDDESYYVIEYNNSTFAGPDGIEGTSDDDTTQLDTYNKHQIGIYSCSTGNITYYQFKDGIYNKVEK